MLTSGSRLDLLANTSIPVLARIAGHGDLGHLESGRESICVGVVTVYAVMFFQHALARVVPYGVRLNLFIHVKCEEVQELRRRRSFSVRFVVEKRRKLVSSLLVWV